jgi:protein involved in polysaccharide export with SLBB domain
VLGSVSKPGRYRFSDDMTILDLLAQAGGPTSDAYQDKIVVVNLGCCQNEARVFNLIDFAKKGDITKMPVVRTGDTVYVPSIAQSDWKIFMEGVRDVVSVLSIFALIGGL